MARHNEVGKWGEELATAYLRKKGYVILERDWHSGHRDIDIIAMIPQNMLLVFVEVKTRTSDFMRPEKAVTVSKMHNIISAANHYIKRYNMAYNSRFDTISIVGENEAIATIDHIESAFHPMTCPPLKRSRRYRW